AFLTAYYMRVYGATREDFGKLCVAQRANALKYSHALFNKPLTLEEYLSARSIAEPLHLFDCVIPLAGGVASVVLSEARANALGRAGRRRGRLPRHGGSAAAADRPSAGAPGQGCETRPSQRLRHDQLRPWSRFRRGDPPMLDKPKRKNPVLRTRLPTLPPAARSRAALGLTAAAALGRFELQQCRDCGTVQYPPREACQQCLSIHLQW